MDILKLILSISLVFEFLFSAWLVKVDNDVISTVEFQEFVDFQKTSLGYEVVNEIIRNKETLKGILQTYIDRIIVIREAKNKGYTTKNKKVQLLYTEVRDEFVKKMYFKDHLDLKSTEVNKQEAKNYFKLHKSKDKNIDPDLTWDKLNPQEKEVVSQRLQAEKLQKQQKILLKDLKKIYPVKKNKLTDVYVAVVNGKKIKKTDMNNALKKEGILIDEIAKTPQEKKKVMEKVLEALIFENLVNDEIKKKKYYQKEKIKKAFKILEKEAISQVFLEEEIYKKIPIEEKEIEIEYNKNKKRWENLSRQYDWGKINRLIKESIKQRKASIYIKNYIDEKKEASLIKRNYEELKKIK